MEPDKPKFFSISISLFLWAIFSLFTVQEITAQTAQSLFEETDYRRALEEYLKLLEKDKTNLDYNYKIGMCYLLINDDKSKAIPYLEFVTKQKEFGNEVWFELGRAYQFAYKFDEAIKTYTRYKEKAIPEEKDKADRAIQTCNNAKELVRKPIDVTFENLGKMINSEYPDYYPFVPSDESFIAYTTRRKGTAEMVGYEGYYTCDIFISKVKNGVYTKAKSIGPTINTIEDEELVGLSPDGKTLLVYVESIDEFGDIYMSTAKGKAFQKLEPLPEGINSEFIETEGFISNDQRTIYFASDRKGGNGGTDIYKAHRLNTGEFGTPINIGASINTKYNEAFPRVTDDGKTLFFSSEGHNSMGGYDIFKSTWDEETQSWGEPVNFGYPVNTPEDNMNFALSLNGHDGYISAYKKGGFGDLDIYKITFNSVDDRQSVIRGRILNVDSMPIFADSRISVIDKDEVEIGIYVPNPKTAKFVVTLSPGVYTLNVETDGYPTYTEKIKILGMSDFKEIIEKNFFMLKKGEVRGKKPEEKAPAGKPGVKTPVKKPVAKPKDPDDEDMDDMDMPEEETSTKTEKKPDAPASKSTPPAPAPNNSSTPQNKTKPQGVNPVTKPAGTNPK